MQSHFNAKFHWHLGVHQQPKPSPQAALATGSQPVKRIQPLASEYSHVQVFKQLPPQFECGLDNKRCITHCLQCGPTIVHQGAKLLRRKLINGGSGMTTDNNDINMMDTSVDAAVNPSLGKQLLPDDSSSNCDRFADCSNCSTKTVAEAFHSNMESVELAFVVFRSPEEFSKLCCKVRRPKDNFTGVSEEVQYAVSLCSTRPPHEIIVRRGQWLER